MNEIESEVWLTFPQNPAYKVSSLGNVEGPRGRLTPTVSNRGYLRFWAAVAGQKSDFNLHQVVCELFHGPAPEGKPCALHNNHVKIDCRASNLRWGSQQENVADRQAAGRQKRQLTQEQVDKIRQRWNNGRGESQGALGREFGVTPQYVGKLVRFKTWKLREVAQ